MNLFITMFYIPPYCVEMQAGLVIALFIENDICDQERLYRRILCLMSYSYHWLRAAFSLMTVHRIKHLYYVVLPWYTAMISFCTVMLFLFTFLPQCVEMQAALIIALLIEDHNFDKEKLFLKKKWFICFFFNAQRKDRRWFANSE